MNPRLALWPRRPTKIATKYREHVPDRGLQVRWSRRVAGGPGVCCSLYRRSGIAGGLPFAESELYDFSEDKLQDSVGIKPPKLTD